MLPMLAQRWAYHNVYVKLQDVVAEASGQTWTESISIPN
jgi:hypothetical protein